VSDRRHRGGRSYAIPVWNGIFDHYKRIGPALWVFLWCIDAITKETDGVGLVHGGAPIKLERIAADFGGVRLETVRSHLKILQDGGYIRTRRTPYGQVIEVLHSKKFNIWRKEKHQKRASLPTERNTETAILNPERTALSVEENRAFSVSKEDSAKRLSNVSFDVGVRVEGVQDFESVDGEVSSSSNHKPKPKSDDDASGPLETFQPSAEVKVNGNGKIPGDEKQNRLNRIQGEALAIIIKQFPDETTETIKAVFQVILNRRKSDPVSPNFLVESFRREAEYIRGEHGKLGSYVHILKMQADVEERFPRPN
jgi:hypothetical protein